MSRVGKVNIRGSKYTRRDTLDKGRHNIILDFKATIPSNSYLFVGGTRIIELDASKILNQSRSLGEEILTLTMLTDREMDSILNKLKKLSVGIEPSSSTTTLNNVPCIPSSSLKGAIRSRIEYKFQPVNNEVLSCYSVISPREVPIKYKYRHEKFWGEETIREYRVSCRVDEEYVEVCKVCDIFGAPGLASRVDISNAFPVVDTKLERLKVDNTWYDVIPPNTQFKFTMELKNFSMEDLGLIFVGTEIFTGSPIIIGRFKYRFNPSVGKCINCRYFFGLLKLSVDRIRYVYPDWDYKDLNEVISASRKAIEELVERGYLNLYRGVIKS